MGRTAERTELREYPMARGCPFDPPPELAEVRAEEPVTRVRIWDGSTAWLLTRYADQRAVLADPRFSSDARLDGYPHTNEAAAARRKHSRSFIFMDNPEHHAHRRMLTGNFTVKRVSTMRPRIESIVDDLIDRMLAAGPPADLVADFALPVPSLVICELLGVPYTDHEFFQRCSHTMLNRASTAAQAIAATDELRDYLLELLRGKRNNDTDGVLAGLVNRQVADGEIGLQEAADMAILLLVAGHETTANMIALGTLALLRHPDQLALLRDDPDDSLVSSAVEELLRYLTITHLGRRRVALEDAEVGGVRIRAGEGVILPNDIGNRDDAVFDEPDTLDITRTGRSHIAFGYGIHQCLGQPLARMELQVVYGTLFRRIPGLRLDIPFDDVPFRHDMTVYGVHRLPVSW